MAKRVIILRGEPLVNEDGVASAAIKPGHLVDGVLSVAPHAVAGGRCARTFALDREEMGAGIDDTYRTQPTVSSDYAIGDTVKVGSFAPGMRVNALIADGVAVTINGFLESAGDGTLRPITTGVAIARALQTITGVGLTRIRVEVY